MKDKIIHIEDDEREHLSDEAKHLIGFFLCKPVYSDINNNQWSVLIKKYASNVVLLDRKISDPLGHAWMKIVQGFLNDSTEGNFIEIAKAAINSEKTLLDENPFLEYIEGSVFERPFEYKSPPVLPAILDDNDMLNTILAMDTSSVSVQSLANLSTLTDESLATILGVTVKTLRSYKQPNALIKGVLREHVIYLHTMFTHGNSLFGTKEAFTAWLSTPNFLLDSKAPVSYLNSITGTKFIDSRLTALEHGDNV